ncbi:MAG TPA: Gfo/Idh/MocA family oxidoreductase [Vicinamibacteria bacterium]
MATRRRFLRNSALAVTAAGLARRAVAAPSDRVRVGFVGVGNRGDQLLDAFAKQPDVEVAALCDVYEPYLRRDPAAIHPRFKAMGRIPRMRTAGFASVPCEKDFRRLLDRKDVDAVVIATPDHWHAVQTIQALAAGKDVYVEKPLTITLVEGRKMVEAQRRTGRVVQVGLNRRGSPVYQELQPLVRDGLIGKVTLARAYRVDNMAPSGIGREQPEDPPPGFDWDLWLGPRAARPYQFNIAPYRFRWWRDYSSQMGNWGVHYMDAIRWLIGERAPAAISAHGGRFAVDDDRTIPDTMEVTFEMPGGALVVFGIYEAGGGSPIAGGEIELVGTKGTLVASEEGWAVRPSRPGQFQEWRAPLVEARERRVADPARAANGEDSTERLVRNFLDCVKSRGTPWCPLEEGHRSTSFAHLANIALETKSRLAWDADREQAKDNPAANARLHYEYRKPWTLG